MSVKNAKTKLFLMNSKIKGGESLVIWQLPVKQSNLTSVDWVHPKAKYHAFVNDRSLCGKYGQSTGFFETTIEPSNLTEELACKKCFKKLK